MSGVSGQAGLSKWINAARRLNSAGFRQSISSKMAAKTLDFVRQSFATSTDPYGAPWPPLRYRSGKPLVLTGRLQGSITVQVANGFVVVSAVHYGAYHNYGTRVIPKRQFIPTAGLPPRWLAAYQKIFANEMRSIFAV